MTKQIPIVSYGTDAVFTLRLRWSERKVAVHDGPNVSYQHQPSEPLDMSLVTNVSVTLRREMCRKSVVPPYKIEGQMLRVEFPASLQEVGDWQAHIVCNVVDTTLEDGIMQYSVSVPICSVVRSDQLLSDQPVQHVDVDVWAMLKGAPGDKGEPLRYEDLTEEQIRSLKGDPGDPTELLGELSRQQSARMDEIATAQRESLTSIRARLSDEQRTALEELAGRLSREQAGQIAQQTERLSTEQASGLQVISDRLSSEQAQILERQAQERAGAQAEALKALDEQVNRKHDTALEGLSGKVSEAVEVQLPRLVVGKVAEAVDAKLPAVAGNKIAEVAERELPSVVGAQLPAALTEQLPSQLSESLPSIIGLDDQSRLTIGGQPIGESLKGADGRDAEPWDSLFSLATEKDLALPDKVWYKIGVADLDGAVDFIDAGESGGGFSVAPESGMPYMSSGSVNKLKPHYDNYITQIYRIPIRRFLGVAGRRFLRVVKTSYFSESPKLRVYVRSIRRKSDNYPEGWSHKSGNMVAYMDATGLTDEYIYVIMTNLRHRTWLSRVDVWTDAPVKIEYYGTWLARPKSPKRAQHYLCSNIAIRAGASYPIALYYTGHKWVTAWGATIQGDTTEEAQQSFNGAVQALRDIIGD